MSRHSIKSRLTRLILITIMAVLGVSGMLLLSYEVLTYRHATVRSIGTLADILAQNSAICISADDRPLARSMLEGLIVGREVVAATLFDRDGREYATYQADSAVAPIVEIPGPTGTHVGSRSVTVVRPVRHAGFRVGTLVLRGSFDGMYQRLLAYALFLVGVVAISASTALTISRILQRRITAPLLELARAARVVSVDKDFSARARITSRDEVGELTHAFNTMLDQIVLSNAALRQSDERFRTLADNIAQVAWMADASGAQLWFNRRWEQFLGRANEVSATRQFFADRHHPEHRERVLARWQAAVAAGRPWEDTFPLMDRHGRYRWFLCHAVPICDDAGQVVHWFGTNTDITEFRDVQQQLRESRDQAIAASHANDDFLARLPHGTIPEAAYWDLSDPYYHLRVEHRGDHDLAIFGGEDHKTGQEANTAEAFLRLEERFLQLVPQARVDHRWSGQVVESHDGLPFIGETAPGQFIATAFAGNGMTFGTLAAMMFCDAVLGRTNPWTKLFDPGRKKVRGSAWTFLAENKDYPYYLLRDHLAGGEDDSLDTLGRGEGKILKLDGKKVAAYRDTDGTTTVCSAVCTHLGCIVAWNNAERTWDCPCHGSRFKPTGEVISGPAESPLERRSPPPTS